MGHFLEPWPSPGGAAPRGWPNRRSSKPPAESASLPTRHARPHVGGWPGALCGSPRVFLERATSSFRRGPARLPANHATSRSGSCRRKKKGQHLCALTPGPCPGLGRDSADDFREPFLPSPSHEFPGSQARLGVSREPRPIVRPSLGRTPPSPCPTLCFPALLALLPDASTTDRSVQPPYPCPPPDRFCRPQSKDSLSVRVLMPSRPCRYRGLVKGICRQLLACRPLPKIPAQLSRHALSDTPAPGSGPGVGHSG
jgi:hypothetical protein